MRRDESRLYNGTDKLSFRNAQIHSVRSIKKSEKLSTALLGNLVVKVNRQAKMYWL